MKIFSHICLLLLTFWSSRANTQIVETIRPPAIGTSEMKMNNHNELIRHTPPHALLDPVMVAQQKKWNPSLAQHGINHGSSIPQSKMDSIKQAGSILKKTTEALIQKRSGR